MRAYTPGTYEPNAYRESNRLLDRTLDRYTRGVLHEGVVSRISGTPPETIQNRTQWTHIQSQDIN